MASIRRRRLPAQQVVWLVIALALYRHQSSSEMVDELDLALPARDASFVSKSVVTQARQRTGAAPLAWLFRKSACNWGRLGSGAVPVQGVLAGASAKCIHTKATCSCSS